MCGLFGWRSADNNGTNVTESLLSALAHRGPDDQGTYVSPERDIVLGHTRLSIIDLSEQGHQPMSNVAGSHVIVFNGELYNYRELREDLARTGVEFRTDSDTEVVLNAYATWGAECLQRFRGMFAFCIHDLRSGELFLARDRFGIKPLLYSTRGDRFVFCSELMPLVRAGLVSRTMRMESIGEFFRYGAVRQPHTILDDVLHLLPGHWMKVSPDLTTTTGRYYDFTSSSSGQSVADYSDAVSRVREALESATRYHLVADVEVGAFLSGGIDSTATVALMQKMTGKPIRTFSVGFEGSSGVTDESELAADTARQLGTLHTAIKVDDKYVASIFDDYIEHLDQPSADGINTYIVSREASKEVKVALSGLGGDELFAGYPHFETIARYSQRSAGILRPIAEAINGIRPNNLTNPHRYRGRDIVSALDDQRIINRHLDRILNGTFSLAEVSEHPDLSPIQQVTIGEFDNYLLSTLLRDADVTSMANSLELRPVLLDHKLAELALCLDDNYKIREGRFKAVFVDAVRDLIPDAVIQHPKTGFEMPFQHWLNTPLNDSVRANLECTAARELLSAEYLAGISRRLERRQLARPDWMTLVFLAWTNRHEVSL